MSKNHFLRISLLLFIAASIVFWGCSSGRRTTGPAATVTVPAGQQYFLFLSDVHLDETKNTTGKRDDAGMYLWDSIRTKITTFLTQHRQHPPAFILYTGDLPVHGTAGNPTKWDPNIDIVLNDLRQMSGINNTPVLYMPGNNDSRSGNYCLFTNSADSANSIPFPNVGWYAPYPYELFHVSKNSGSNGAYMVADDSIKSGYYTTKIRNLPLRVISLNSVMWSATSSYCTGADSVRPALGDAQMAWLGRQLDSASAAGDKVYLAMHIPPGIDAYSTACPGSGPCQPICNPVTWANMWRTFENTTSWQYRFLRMIALHKGTVAGVFFGHTHLDEFRMLYDPQADTITQVAISCPGISVRNGNNPGYKLVYFDNNTLAPTDFTTIYTDSLDQAGTWPSGSYYSYHLSDYLAIKGSSSILEALKGTTDTERQKVLQRIYTVQRNAAKTPCYYYLGLNVKSAPVPSIDKK